MPPSSLDASHYLWAGLDFMIDREGRPVLLEANRSSHMLGEYMEYHANELPFQIVAQAMNAAGGVPCLLWRRSDPLPDADEDACYIGTRLSRYLRQPPVICNVEDNQEPRTWLVARDGTPIEPGSIFRWWYGLPSSFEQAGVLVINPNALWRVVRDKYACCQTLAEAREFRMPRSFPVEQPADVKQLLAEQSELFRDGYVLKPRIGWGGHGVQVACPGEAPREFHGRFVLSERIIPTLRQGRYWDVRTFVMGGQYLGGVQHSSERPVTNYFQGGRPDRLDAATSSRLEPAALEAVRLLNAAAEAIITLPGDDCDALIRVEY